MLFQIELDDERAKGKTVEEVMADYDHEAKHLRDDVVRVVERFVAGGYKPEPAFEVDLCFLCGWAKGADGVVPARCPLCEARCYRVPVNVPKA